MARPRTAIALILAGQLVLGATLSHDAAADATESGPAPAKLFGSIEFKGKSLAALPQWLGVLAQIAEQTPAIKACDDDESKCVNSKMAAWRAQIKVARGLTDKVEQMRRINKFVNNGWPYKRDEKNYGEPDHWAPPLEFIAKSGDCEDYSILKYVSLKDLGFDPDSIRIVVVKDTVRNEPHAILAVYLDDKIYILDSLSEAVKTHDAFPQYVPQYSVNETTRWAHVIPKTKG